MKNKERNGLLWLLLCIPLPIIIYFGIIYSQNEISNEDIRSVIVTDTSGLQGKYSTDRDSIDFFVNLILNAETVDSAWRDFESEKPVELAFERNNGSVFRQYVYAELDADGCFIVDKDGKIKRISSDDAIQMLARPEWKYLYEPLMLPQLTIEKNGDSDQEYTPVPPKEYDWHYKKSDGKYTKDTDTKLITNNFSPVYINGNDYDFVFSSNPDVVKVVLRDGDAILEDNSLQSLIYSSDTELSVEIEATWEQGKDSKYYGTAKWSFDLVYDVQPKVTLESSEFYPGEVIALKFVNLSDGETLKVETSLTTSEIKTVKGNECKYVFLPIPSTVRSGNYNLKVAAGEGNFDFEINVKEKTFGIESVVVDARILNEAFKPENKTKFDELVAKLSSESAGEALYSEQAFIAPATDTNNNGADDPTDIMNKTLTYGMTVIYNNSDPPYVTYRGKDINTSEGSIVKASQRGTVVYNGEIAETGKTLIIDHGNGILSYYFHLSNALSPVGRTVQQGEIIGNSGSTGLTDKTKLCFAVSVNGVFVDPDFMITSGLPF